MGGFRGSGGRDFDKGGALGIREAEKTKAKKARFRKRALHHKGGAESPHSKLGDERDFTGGARGEDINVGLRSVLERQFFCDDGAKGSVSEAGRDPSQDRVALGFS